jgi:ribosomal protein L16 Arg81 hydroxylase
VTLSLSELLAPVGASALAQLDEPRPALVMRGERARFDAVLTPQRFEAIVAAAPGEHLDLIRAGTALAVTSRVAGQKAESGPDLAQLAAEGTSLRVRRIHLLDAKVMELALALHAELREELHVNAYWSPAAVELGLGPHTDGYDVLVLQLAGAKGWTLHGEPEHALASEGATLRGRAGRFVLERGDVLFLPAGLRHHADNRGAEPSLHLTIGILTKSERSVLEWLASEAEEALHAPFATHAGADVYAAALERARGRLDELLGAPDRVERFLAYREGVEVERIYASVEEHERKNARGYR